MITRIIFIVGVCFSLSSCVKCKNAAQVKKDQQDSTSIVVTQPKEKVAVVEQEPVEQFINYKYKVGDKVCIMEKMKGWIVKRYNCLESPGNPCYMVQFIDAEGVIDSSYGFVEGELTSGDCY